MSWHLGRMAAFDLETTGPDPREARIVTAAVTVTGGDQLDEPHSWLVDPGVEIPAGAIAVHGITNEMAREQGTPAPEAVASILEVLSAQVAQGIPIVAFNARFDMTVLDREARRHGLVPLGERFGEQDLCVIDPYVLDKQFDRFRRGKRTLGDVCAHYGVGLMDAHTAGADAAAAVEIVRKMVERTDQLRQLELVELHCNQVAWAAEQARSLQDYFNRQGRNEYVEPAWPVIPLQATPEAEPLPAAA
jgi:DNA polymerase-3 subunit epsilon